MAEPELDGALVCGAQPGSEIIRRHRVLPLIQPLCVCQVPLADFVIIKCPFKNAEVVKLADTPS